MSADLIARLKAAHEAATPGPWVAEWTRIGGPDSYVVLATEPVVEVVARTNNHQWGWDNAELIALTRNALPEIIAALEEREWLRAVVEVARATELREPDMRQGYWPHNWPEMQALRAALDELEGKS